MVVGLRATVQQNALPFVRREIRFKVELFVTLRTLERWSVRVQAERWKNVNQCDEHNRQIMLM